LLIRHGTPFRYGRLHPANPSLLLTPCDATASVLGTNRNLFTLVQAEKWNGVLPTTMVPGSVPFVSLKQG
jgi:hypothetical protein